MKFSLYSDRDLKVGFSFPYSCPSDEYAIRDFKRRVSMSDMNYAPADYQLFKVGEFNTETACIEPCLPVLLFDGGEIGA